MVTYAEALALLLAATRPLEGECVDIDGAMGRLLAADIASPLSLPAFDSAAMDGYALRTSGGGLPAGATYTVAAMHAAGDTADAYPDADACEIATGARMPSGFDTVVPVERSARIGSSVVFASAEPPGQNVRTEGSDVRRGDTVLPAGRRIEPSSIMLLAALGVASLPVVRRPRVAIVATGSELNARGPLPPGGIHDSNGPYLAACVARWGAEIVLRTRVPDGGDAFHHAVGEARDAQADLIITTGAVSAGRFDFVPAALAAMGAGELFHKVAMRPGKPLLAAAFEGGPLVMALPGNPIAVAVGFRFFVVPVLRAMAGLAVEKPRRVRLSSKVPGRGGMHHFAFGRDVTDAAGYACAEVMPAQAAYRILPYTQATLWLSSPDPFGEEADAWLLDPASAA